MYIIVKEYNCRLTASINPQVHQTMEKAKEELQRLVKANPGTNFHLFSSIGSMKAEVQLKLSATGVMDASNNSYDL